MIIYDILSTISTLKTTNAFIQFEYFYITKNKCESTLQALNGTKKTYSKTIVKFNRKKVVVMAKTINIFLHDMKLA